MKKILVAGVCMAIAATAHAAYIDESSANPFATTHRVRIIGADTFGEAVGFAKDDPVMRAVVSIVPRSYKVTDLTNGAFASTKVDWVGWKPWPEALKEVAERVESLRIDIDADGKEVTVRSAQEKAAVASAPVVDASPKEMGQAEMSQPTEMAQAVDEPVATWTMRSDGLETVRSALNKWAALANWTLVWDMPVDFPVEAHVSLSGGFKDSVATVIDAMQGSESAPQAIFYEGNRVLRIVARGTE